MSILESLFINHFNGNVMFFVSFLVAQVWFFVLWSRLRQVAAMKTYGLGLEFISPPMRNNEKARYQESFCDVIFCRLPLWPKQLHVTVFISLLNGWIPSFVPFVYFWDVGPGIPTITKSYQGTNGLAYILSLVFVFAGASSAEETSLWQIPDMLLEKPFSFLLERTASGTTIFKSWWKDTSATSYVVWR